MRLRVKPAQLQGCKRNLMRKLKTKNSNFLILICGYVFLILNFTVSAFAQDNELTFTVDIASATTATPKIFKPSVDLSGRGFSRDISWPQSLAAPEALDNWQKDIGLRGFYRIQYNLWEIYQLAKNKKAQDKLMANYEDIIKRISDAGGVVILNIFGTPAGLGKALDKKSPPVNFKAFKELIKEHIKRLSCDNRFNIWYEVWSAPDLDDFFLGRKQEYLNLYRSIAEAVRELESEYKIHIPLGGPSVSAWFQNTEPNTVITPERGLIYELIRYCYHYHLPLDFISWHDFSADYRLEKDTTLYKKNVIALIRDWLTYFKFNRNTPFIIDEWNYDRGLNVLSERRERANVAASYIPARLSDMYAAGLDYQTYFSLEDFQNNKEGIVRNTGVFWFDSESSGYKGGPKSIYNVFRMLNELGDNIYAVSAPPADDFVRMIATSSNKDKYISLLIYNYINQNIATGIISENIAILTPSERKLVIDIVKSDRLNKLMAQDSDIASLKTTKNLKSLLKKAKELNDKAAKFSSETRNVKIVLKNINGDYVLRRYVVDSSCASSCAFVPAEEKNITVSGTYSENINIGPYSVEFIVLTPKPKDEPKSTDTQTNAQPVKN